MAAAENSRMLRVVASVPVLSFPSPPEPSPLGFHRAYLSLLDDKDYVKLFNARHARRSITFYFVHFFCPRLRINSAVLLVFLRQDESA